MAEEQVINEQPQETDNMYEYINDIFYSSKKKGIEGRTYISRSFFKKRIKEHQSLSADWDKKTIPPESPEYTQKHKGFPNKYGVISQLVGDLFQLPEFKEIDIDPTQISAAHCNILFQEDVITDDRLLNILAKKLRKKSKWEIEYPKLKQE